MKKVLSLQGIRIHLSASIPDDAALDQRTGILLFAAHFARAVFRGGGSLLHGSHPTIVGALLDVAAQFVQDGGAKDALILVRAQEFAISNDHLVQMAEQRKYCAIEVVPASAEHSAKALVPMREWMAERCDLIVAIGGRHWEVNQANSGVPEELEEALSRGKPGFALAGFGGSISGYIEQQEGLLSRLKNGLPTSANRELALSTDVDSLVNRIIAQTQLLPLARGVATSGRLFRILALDGGGLRGAFTAAVLAKWDDMIKTGGGNEIVKHFDLVAGTSTGALLAIGLGLGMSPAAMLAFYRNEGPKIFPKNRKLRHWLKSKHESSTLRTTLEAIFGNRRLKESCCRLVLPTVRAIHGESEAIVTAHTADRTGFAEISAVEAALASSAAPTYFDEAVVDNQIAPGIYLDGGIWANNPVLPAIAEAIRHLRVPINGIDVLSLGTLGSEMDFTESLGKGLAGWAPTSADLFFAAQEHAAANLADSLLSPARHLRINQRTPSEIRLDDVEAIEDMALRGANVAQDSFVAVRSRFLDGFHVPDWKK